MRGVVTTKRQSGRRDSKDGKEISKGDYAKVDFYNVMRTINGKVSPIYNTQVPADKGKEFQLNIPEFFTETGSNEDAAKLFVGYVQNELNHMLQAEELISDLIGKELKELPSGAVRASFEDMQDGITYAKHISNLVIRQNELNDEDRHNLMSLIENVSNHLTVVYHLKGDTFINL